MLWVLGVGYKDHLIRCDRSDNKDLDLDERIEAAKKDF